MARQPHNSDERGYRADMGAVTGPAAPRYAANDVPGLRRLVADYYGSQQGVNYYLTAIRVGRQPMRPPGPAVQAAQQLAAAETARLRNGDLWYLDEDLCALLAAAHPSMPAFAPRPHDLPSKVGFALFADPIDAYPGSAARDDKLLEKVTGRHDAEVKAAQEKLWELSAPIVAVSWSPFSQPDWPAGGLWMSFYTISQLHARDDLLDPRTLARARANIPPLTVDNEAAIAWRPEGAPVEGYQLPAPDASTTTLTWARLVFATFQLAAQGNLAERDTLPTPRPERRRAEKAGLPPRDVRLIRLRRSLADARADDGDGGREWRHRWVELGHWRKHWYPSIRDHRPLWIAPYLKGPGDAPLLGGEKVTLATAEPPSGASSNE